MKKRIFISVGMTGREAKDVENDLNGVELDMLVERIKSGGSLTDLEFVNNFYCEKPEGSERLYCLGEAIKKLSDCDACYFVKGWQNYRGCIIERYVCKLYNIEIIDEP